MADITELVIDRARWLRGSDSVLLDTGGCMCCLGFLGKAFGIEDCLLLEASTPETSGSDEWCNGTFRDDIMSLTDAAWITAAIVVNDDDAYDTDASREAALIKLFAKQGITLSFV